MLAILLVRVILAAGVDGFVEGASFFCYYNRRRISLPF